MTTGTQVYHTPAVKDFTPVLSVVIPCYNHAPYLQEAVESVLRQTEKRLEIIIVNDGSKDDSLKVARRLLETYSHRAITLVDQPNSGEPAISRNNGIQYARGTWILPLDADDYLAEDALDKYLSATEQQAGKEVVVYGWMQRFGAVTTCWKTRPFDPNELLRGGKLPNSSLYSRSLWEKGGGYQLGIPGYEDWEFWINCAEQGAIFINLPEIVYYYRATNIDSMQKSARRKHEWLTAKIFLMHPALYEEWELRWAEEFLAEHSEPPENRVLHSSDDKHPKATSLLIAAYPKLYEESEIRWAADTLAKNPPVLQKGIRRKPDSAMKKNSVQPAEANGETPWKLFEKAFDLYNHDQFADASEMMNRYRQIVKYDSFERKDRRKPDQPTVSVILVAYNTKELLLDCLRSLESQVDKDFEIILVDNGGNEEVWSELALFPLLHVRCPMNLVLSEGRNVGAHFARGEILAFLDDDALVNRHYIESIRKAFRTYDIVALRGKVIPKTSHKNNNYAPHYDYGKLPIPSSINTEGNSASLRSVYLEFNGQDPLLFGAEGLEMSYRMAKKIGWQRIIYWPETVIYHDYAQDDSKLTTKTERHERSKQYLVSRFPDIFRWHYSFQRFRENDATRRQGEALIPRKASDREEPGQPLHRALSEKGWEKKAPLYEPYLVEVRQNRKVRTPAGSVIVVTTAFSEDLHASLAELRKQANGSMELILVNNGASTEEMSALQELPDLLITLSENTGAYLSRNIGSAFASGGILIFIDDDATPHPDLLSSHLRVHGEYEIIALRGPVLPKSENPLNKLAGHYYPGNRPFPLFSDVEGNVSYRADLFYRVGGWDDEIIFGGGGVDLARRLVELEPDLRKQIYHPAPIIYHDYARDEQHLEAKRQKQKKSHARLRKKHPDFDRFLALWQPLRNRSDLLIHAAHLGKLPLENGNKSEPTSPPDSPGTNPIQQAVELAHRGHLRAAKARLSRLLDDPTFSVKAKQALEWIEKKNGHDRKKPIRIPPQKRNNGGNQRISVLIPTCNRAEFLAEAIASALLQSSLPDEIVIVDDGSDDNTEEVVRAINNDRVRYIRKEHSGAPATRNRAVREAKGDFILWLDSDDILLEGTVERYRELVAGDPEVDVLYGDLVITDGQLNEKRYLSRRDWRGRREELLAAMLHENVIPNPGSLIRRSAFQRVGEYNEKFRRAHDYEWWVRAVPLLNFRHCGKAVLKWRWHDSNMSTGSVRPDLSYDARIVRFMIQQYGLRRLFPKLDWSPSRSNQSDAVARLQVAHRFINLHDYRNGMLYLQESYNRLPSPEIRQLITSLTNLLSAGKGDNGNDPKNNNSAVIEDAAETFCEPPVYPQVEEPISISKKPDRKEAAAGEHTSLRKRRVLIVCDYWLPSLGGTELMVLAKARAFRDLGWEVHVATRELLSRNEFNVEGITIRDLPVEGMACLDGEKKQSLLNDLRSGFYQAVFAVAAPTCWVPWLFQGITGVPVYHVTCINAQGFTNWKMNPEFREPLKALFRQQNHHVITLTATGFDTRFCREEGIPFTFVPNGLDRVEPSGNFRSRLGLAEGVPLLLHVGNFFPVKNQAGLIHALESMMGEWHLLLIGHPVPGYEAYFEEVNRLVNTNPGVTLLPGVSREEVAGAMKEADLLLLSSEGEGAPLVLLEAMSHGLPWVARPTCGAAVEYGGGFIVPLHRFASFIPQLLNHPEVMQQTGSWGEQRYRRYYNQEQMTDRYCRILEQGVEKIDSQTDQYLRDSKRPALRNLITEAESVARNAPLLSLSILDNGSDTDLRRTLDSIARLASKDFETRIIAFRNLPYPPAIAGLRGKPAVHQVASQDAIEQTNLAFTFAHGKYVVVLSSGSEVLEDGLSQLLELAGRSESPELIFSDLERTVPLPPPGVSINGGLDLPAWSGVRLLPAMAGLTDLPLFGFAVQRDFFDRTVQLQPEFSLLAWQEFFLRYAGEFRFTSLGKPFAAGTLTFPVSKAPQVPARWFFSVMESRYAGSPGLLVTPNLEHVALPWWLKLARSYAMIGAAEQVNRLLNGRKESAELLTFEAQIVMQNDRDKAAGMLERALEIDPLCQPAFSLLRAMEQQLPPAWKQEGEDRILTRLQKAETEDDFHHAALLCTRFFDAPRAIPVIMERLLESTKQTALFFDLPQTAEPLVTFVLPYYNGKSKYIGQTLDSIANQNFSGWECVIVDDGCRDETTRIVENWLEQKGDTRFRIVHQENGGAGAARNRGATESEAPFLAFIDSDDLLHPNFAGGLLAAFDKESDIGWLYPLTIQFGKFNRIWGTDAFHPRAFLQVNRCPVSALVQRKMFDMVGGFDEKMKDGYEDWELWIHAISEGWRGKRVDKILYFYRKQANSLNERIDPGKEIAIKQYMMKRHRLFYELPDQKDLHNLALPRAIPDDFIRGDAARTWIRRNEALRQRMRRHPSLFSANRIPLLSEEAK